MASSIDQRDKYSFPSDPSPGNGETLPWRIQHKNIVFKKPEFSFALPAQDSSSRPLEPGKIDLHLLIKKAKPGSRIVLDRGLYYGHNLVIDKPLELIGKDFPVIDGQSKGTILRIKADGVTIRGICFQNVGVSFLEDRAAIKVSFAKNCTLQNNRLLNTFFGIYLKKSENCTLENNWIVGKALKEATSGNGIHLWYCKKIRIWGNYIARHRDGIYLEFVEDSDIQRNLSENHLRYGLHFMYSHRNQYLYNKFRNNGAGVTVMYTRKVVMKYNHFVDNWGTSACGLLLKELHDCEISHNFFHNNTTGIYSDGTDGMVIKKNLFLSNGYAIKLMGAINNDLQKNNFLQNTFDIATNSSKNGSNYFFNNYWSAYEGYDLDRDGIGDVPFHPVRLFAYTVEKQPSSIIFLRSFFVNLLDTGERVMPLFTPENLVDEKPLMKPVEIKFSPEE